MTDIPADVPMIPAEPAAPVTPAAPVSLADASAAWRAAPDPTPPARNPDGTFAAVTSASTTDAPTATTDPATTEPQPPASADDPSLYLEAKVGDETIKLRKDTLIPQVRHGQVEWKPLDKVRTEGMLKADYDLKMQERKEHERQVSLREAELNARAAQFEAEEARLRAAQRSPEEWEKYQTHLQRYAEDPDYKQLVDDRDELQMRRAREHAHQTVQEQEVIRDAVSTATDWITEAVSRHPGVDSERVRTRYGQALAAGTARFDPADVEAIVADEAKAVAAVLTPLQQQMASLQAEIDRLKASSAAQTRNEGTQHALRRAQTVPTGPAGGAPPAPGRRELTTENGKRDLTSLSEAWKRA